MNRRLRYKATGSSRTRIDKLLLRDCKCKRGQCFHGLKQAADQVEEFLGQFYSLDRFDQDEFVAWLLLCQALRQALRQDLLFWHGIEC